jgi:hypothetical protein
MTKSPFADWSNPNCNRLLAMIDLGYMVEFDDQQVLIQKRCLDPSWVLARGVGEGGL